MKRDKSMQRAACAQVGLVLSAALACGKAGNPTTLTSSSSNWLQCTSDPECLVHEAGAYCGGGYCFDSAGNPLSLPTPEGGAGSGPGSAASTSLPSGGRELADVKLNLMQEMVVDEGGVIWLSACEGLFAIKDSEVRRYTWLDAPIAERGVSLDLLADAQNRTWIFDYGNELQVIEDGAFRSVFSGPIEMFSVGRDGSAWVSASDIVGDTTRAWIRQVAPILGEEIDIPESNVNSIAASEPGALVVSTNAGVYRWAEGTWSGPFAPDAAFVYYDPRQDVLSVDNARLRWTGSGFESEPLFADPSPLYGRHLGFDAQGRLITVNDTAVRWIENGEVVEEAALSGFDQMPVSALGPGGAIYLASSTSISRLSGETLSHMLDLERFDPEVEFSWRAQPFGATLAAPVIEATDSDFGAPGRPLLIGSKLHVSGIAFGGFETAGLQIDGAIVPDTWANSAGELSTFMSERGLSVFQAVDETTNTPDPNAPAWDLYGYFEAGTCFGHLDGMTRQFWVVEGYPADMPTTERQALEDALRERYAAPEQ